MGLPDLRELIPAGGSDAEADAPAALPRVAVGRLLAILFAASGLTAFADVLPPSPAGTNVALTAIIATVALAAAPVLWRLPWASWPRRASLGILPVVFALIAVGNLVDPNPYTYGLPFVTTFLWLGAAHRRWTSVAVLPLASVSYVGPLLIAPEPVSGILGSTLFTMALCAVLGETLGWVMERLSRTQTELAARRSEARFRALVQNGAELVTILTADGIVQYCGPSLRTLLDRDPEGIIGTPLWEHLHPDDKSIGRGLVASAVMAPQRTHRAELRLRHGDGSWRQVEAICADRRDTPEIGGLVLNVRDVTERKSLERELAHRALHDALTELPNRALLVDRLGHGLARAGRLGRTTAVLFIDLDDFKVINDSLGHHVGDELLVCVAQHVHASLRPGDTAARLGGDQFVVLLEDLTTPADATSVAERFLERLRSPIALSAREVVISASIGVAVSTDADNMLADDLLRQADLAMCAAKKRGRNQVAVFDESLHERSLDRLELETDLRRALDAGELRVYYQPIVELHTQRVSGVEALVRWAHPARGLISPDQFIPLAEETGLIVPLGRWVLREACRQAQVWHRASLMAPITVSVNLSARQFRHPQLVEHVAAALHESGLAACYLKLEITESVAMEEGIGTIQTLQALKGLGVLLAIDDFGTGYSSLAYLRRFPVDTLKVDRAFVEGLGHDAQNSAIVRSVIELARALGLSVTAEGVETAEQLRELGVLGCQEIQGFYFARPQPADIVTKLLSVGSFPIGELAALAA